MRLFERGPGPWIQPIKDQLKELVIEGELAAGDKEAALPIARRLYTQLGLDQAASSLDATHTAASRQWHESRDRSSK